MPTDPELEAAVLEAIRAEGSVDASGIAVAVRDGVVTLDGTVDSLPRRYAAVRAASRVHGVRAIADEIVVQLPDLAHAPTDQDIAHAAVAALTRDTAVPEKTITVRVQDRCIWLVGEAETHEQRLAAERAVEILPGVRAVTNLVRLRPRRASPETVALIEAALLRDARLARRGIGVAVDGGAVTLLGRVASLDERAAAERAAWSAPGVMTVDDRLVVGTAAPPA